MRARLLLALVLLVVSACDRLGPPPPVTMGNASDSAGGGVIVARGDSLYTLSRRYNVPLRDLIDANRLAPPYKLEAGQRLVLPAAGQYIVQKGDTLTTISRMFNIEMTELSRLNGLSPPYAVHSGQPLRLPAGGGRITETADSGSALRGGTPSSGSSSGKTARGGIQVTELPPPGESARPSSKPSDASDAGSPGESQAAAEGPKLLRPPPSKPVDSASAADSDSQEAEPSPKAEVGAAPPRGAARFLWPVKGKVISGFGPKPDGMNNDGINIGAPAGTGVMAAENGVVAYAGNELRGFGNLLLVKHDGGWITAYAHLSRMDVERGAKVKRGQRIGAVGQTGSVTAPQLHFELRKGSHVVDPRDQMEGSLRVSEGISPDGRRGPG